MIVMIFVRYLREIDNIFYRDTRLEMINRN